jgi:uncharacterized protein
MMLLVYVIVGLLLALGLLGALLPVLPGTPLILAAAIIYAVATGGHPIGLGRIAILAGLAALGFGLDYVAGALGARQFGGTRWAVGGAVAGAVVGLFFGPLGLLLGPFTGAVGGELIRSRQLDLSLRSGAGALVGLLVGAAAKFTVALVMVGLFLWWAWR